MLKDVLESFLSEDRRPETLETQLEKLNAYGIAVKPGVSADDLLENFSREELEQEPYTLLLPVLGGSRMVSEDVYEPISDNILFIDANCIESADIYLEILDRLQTMTGGALALENAAVSADEGEGAINVSFTLSGEDRLFTLAENGTEIDADFFSAYNGLLREAGAAKRIYLSVSSDSLLVIFMEKKSVKPFNKLTISGFYEA